MTIKKQIIHARISLWCLPALTLVASCNFNAVYLHPTTVPAGAKKLTLSTGTDSTHVFFNADNYQPVFVKNSTDTLVTDYSIESVVFTGSTGNKLNGWMMKPKNQVAETTLLHLHGNAGFIVSQYQAMTPLLPYGFQVFIFDYSGFGFSEGKATRQQVLIDANDALNYIKTRKDVGGTKLVIYGQSLGGHLAAVVAAKRQSEIDGLVIEGAFSSHKDIAAETAGFIGRLLVKEHYSARKSIAEFKKPVLIIHSTEDEIIPFEMGKILFENANNPKEFYEIKHCHMCGPDYYAESISQKIKKMIHER
jgi:pimeloyl-ACP methyl ester carboxylesterase